MGKTHKNGTCDLMAENDGLQPPQKKPKNNNKKEDDQDKRINVKIEMVKERPDKSLPLIAYFPSGYDPDEQAEEPSVKILRHVKRKHRVKVVVKPSESSPVTFVGTNYSGEGAVPQMCSYAVGVFDKEAKTLKIVPVEGNKIFRMEPKFGDDDTAIVDEAMEENEPTLEDTKPNFNFSTKKTQQSAKKEKALRAYHGPEAEEDLNNKMADALVNINALEVCAQASSVGRNIPPHDESATTPQEAYPLKKIILNGERQYLTDIAELLQQGIDIKTVGYPSFVCNRIHKIEDVEDEKVKIYSYMNHLIKFKDKKSKDGIRSFSELQDYKLPNILSQKFNDTFANTESRWLAGDKKDLLIRYVLVLTLFVDDFKTDFTDIAKDLRMTTGALRTHFQSLGCEIVKHHHMTFATLSTPLNFSKSDKRRRRRK